MQSCSCYKLSEKWKIYCAANDVLLTKTLSSLMIIIFRFAASYSISSHALLLCHTDFKEKTDNLHFNFTWHR